MLPLKWATFDNSTAVEIRKWHTHINYQYIDSKFLHLKAKIFRFGWPGSRP